MEELMLKQSKNVMWTFTIIGIIATIAYRIIIVLNFYSPLWVKVSWYIGTIGFILYFGYIYVIQSHRSELAAKHKLVDYIKGIKELKGEKKEALEYVVRSTATSKAKWTSAMILILSVAALIVGIVLDILGI